MLPVMSIKHLFVSGIFLKPGRIEEMQGLIAWVMSIVDMAVVPVRGHVLSKNVIMEIFNCK